MNDAFSTEDYWKALILYGLNQATYKIALGKTLRPSFPQSSLNVG